MNTKVTKLQDGIQSMALKLGQKQEAIRYQQGELLTDDLAQLEAIWTSSWIAQKICNKRAQDMTRRWRDVFSNDLDAEQLEAFSQLERQLKLRETLSEALAWSSLYGSVALLIKTDARHFEQPLQPKERLERLIILPKDKVSGVGALDNDVLSSNYGKYSEYVLNGSVKVHHSRLIILNANIPPLSEVGIWGVSDLEPVYEVIKRFDAASTNIGDLILESKVDIFKIAGLSDKIVGGLENDVVQVISSVQLIKSATNSLVLDTENEYEQKELTFGGLRDLLVEFRNAVAGAADMPVAILFGQSATGFASGEEDIQNYHESIHRLQEKRLRPVLERLDVLLCHQLFGGVPEDWWFEFLPLTELKQEQQINMLNLFSTATTALIQVGVLNEAQVANELKESGLFASISAEDLTALEEIPDDTELAAGGSKYTEQEEAETL